MTITHQGGTGWVAALSGRDCLEFAERIKRRELRAHIEGQAKRIAGLLLGMYAAQKHPHAMRDDRARLGDLYDAAGSFIDAAEAMLESRTALMYGGAATQTFADQRPDSGDAQFRDLITSMRGGMIQLRDMTSGRRYNPTWKLAGRNTTCSVRDGTVEQQMLKECFRVIADIDPALLTEGNATRFVELVRARAKVSPRISHDVLRRALRAFKQIRDISARSITPTRDMS